MILASATNPLVAISLAEVINTSDVPAGVVNVLTGDREELLPQFASHKDVNSIIYCGNKKEEEIVMIFNEVTNEIKKIDLHSKIEFLEEKVSLNLDEKLYSELLSLRNQLKSG